MGAWTRWFVGIALVIVGWIVAPTRSTTEYVTEKIVYKYQNNNDEDVKKVE